jgi:hypothetical protein
MVPDMAPATMVSVFVAGKALTVTATKGAVQPARPSSVTVITVPRAPLFGAKLQLPAAEAGVAITRLRLKTITRAMSARHIELNLRFIRFLYPSLWIFQT